MFLRSDGGSLFLGFECIDGSFFGSEGGSLLIGSSGSLSFNRIVANGPPVAQVFSVQFSNYSQVVINWSWKVNNHQMKALF